MTLLSAAILSVVLPSIATAQGSAPAQSVLSSAARETALASAESRDCVIEANSGEYVDIAVESKGIGV